MFHRSPYYPSSYNNPYYTPQDDYGYGGYLNPYAQAEAQARAEQKRRAQLLELERQRQQEEQLRRAQLEALRQRQRASQYLPEAGMMNSRPSRNYVPERASKYLPDEFQDWPSANAIQDDDDMDAYDYGLGRAGSYWDGLHTARGRERRPSKAIPQSQAQSRRAEHHRAPSQSTPETRSRSPAVRVSTSPRSRSRSRLPDDTTQKSRNTRPPSQHPSPPTPSSKPTSAPESHVTSSSPPATSYSYLHPRDVLDEAATKIQNAYHVHRSLKTIETLRQKFLDLKSSFSYPSTLDFQTNDPERHITIPVSAGSNADPSVPTSNLSTLKLIAQPKLAYTNRNAPLHGYVESLNRLLTSLDGVESFGEKKVREQRKEVVRAVEQEAARVEEVWKTAWDRAIGSLGEGQKAYEQPSSVAIGTTLPASADESEETDTMAQMEVDGPSNSDEQEVAKMVMDAGAGSSTPADDHTSDVEADDEGFFSASDSLKTKTGLRGREQA